VSRLVLDAGALIALDRNDRAMWARLATARRARQPLVTHAGVLGQVWRHPTRQARLGQVLDALDVRPLTRELAQRAGLLLAATGHDDVHDAALALLCESGDVLYTGDITDLGLLLAERRTHSVSLVRV